MNKLHRALAVAALFAAVASMAAAQSVDSFAFDPLVVRADETADVSLRITATGNVTSMALDLHKGLSIPLTQTAGVWKATIPAGTLTLGYTSAEVNRHFVGFIHIKGPGFDTPQAFNASISILDANVPRVTLGTFISGKMRVAPHVMNVLDPNATLAAGPLAPINALYLLGVDAYDFADVVYALPSYAANRYHGGIRSDISGIGKPLNTEAPGYISPAKMKGFTVFPLDTYFDAADNASNHELGHQWINFLPMPALQPGPHWPPSTMARGLMGFNLASADKEGGQFPWDLAKQPDGSYRWVKSTALDEFSDLDLYLMGLIDASAVGTNLVAKDKTKEPCDQCPVAVTPVTISDVIAAAGPRKPSAANSQKDFRIGTVIVSRDRLLKDDELTLLDWFSARGESKIALDAHSGLAPPGKTNPFFLATKQHGSVNRHIEITDRVLFAFSLKPSKVPAAGGTTVTVNGTGLAGLVPITVTVGGIAATGVKITTFSHVLTFVAPPHKAGPADVVITGQIGSVRVPNALTYQ
jgi:hypothetical protein